MSKQRASSFVDGRYRTRGSKGRHATWVRPDGYGRKIGYGGIVSFLSSRINNPLFDENHRTCQQQIRHSLIDCGASSLISEISLPLAPTREFGVTLQTGEHI